jgi:hypothetical protein
MLLGLNLIAFVHSSTSVQRGPDLRKFPSNVLATSEYYRMNYSTIDQLSSRLSLFATLGFQGISALALPPVQI